MHQPNPDPYWWDDVAVFESATPALPETADAVVVGAGLTGSSAALTLAKSGVRVLLVDAHRPGYGASTRNGGMVGGGYRLPFEKMVTKYGAETAERLLSEAHVASLAFARARIESEGIDCDFQTWGRFRGMWNSAEYDQTARGLDALRKLVDVNVGMVPPTEQRREIGTDFYSGAMMFYDHGGLHPGKYLNGMLAAAARAGARVIGNLPVSDVARQGDGFVVNTPRGAIRAGAVLMATNGYTTPDFPALKRRIIPMSSFLIATDDLPEGLAEQIMPGKRMCVETRHRHCYFRLSPDGRRFVIGGRAAMSPISPAKATNVLRGLMEQIFPALKGIRVTHSWTGQTGFTFSTMPQIGRFDGVWHAMGYSGSGNAMAPYLGHKAALLMVGDPAGETAFTETTMETRFWYRRRAWFLPVAHQIFRLVDRREDARRGN